MITIKPIKPKVRQKDFAEAVAVVQREMQRAAEGTLVDLRASTGTWKTKVRFTVRVGADKFSVRTDNKIFGYVDEGTRPHIIRPKRPRGILRFQTGYRAKTMPNVIGSREGGAFGPFATAKEIRHPGSAPRNFSRKIEAKWQERIAQRINEGVKRAIG